MKDNEAEKLDQLHEALQVAAINLINHLQTNHARIRIRGTTPELYITLSEGRNTIGAEASTQRAPQDAPVVMPRSTSFSLFAKLRKTRVV